MIPWVHSQEEARTQNAEHMVATMHAWDSSQDLPNYRLNPVHGAEVAQGKFV